MLRYHMLFFCYDPSIFSLLPIACLLKQNVDITVVTAENFASDDFYEDLSGIKFIKEGQYKIGNEKIDIILFTSPYFFSRHEDIVRHVQEKNITCMYFPYATEFLGHGYCGWICRFPFLEKIDTIFATAPMSLENYLYYQPSVLDHTLCFGNPEIDAVVLNHYQNIPWYKQLQEFKQNRPCFLWTPHWALGVDPFWSTWLLSGPVLSEFFLRHPELCLIIRPHPCMFSSLPQDNKKLRAAVFLQYEQLRALPNVMFDEFGTSLPSICCSDYLISDCSSIMQKFFATQKPIIAPLIDYGTANPVMESCVYFFSEPEELNNMLSAVLLHDPLKEARHNAVDRFVGPHKGFCARNISDFLLSRLNGANNEDRQ